MGSKAYKAEIDETTSGIIEREEYRFCIGKYEYNAMAMPWQGHHLSNAMDKNHDCRLIVLYKLQNRSFHVVFLGKLVHGIHHGKD